MTNSGDQTDWVRLFRVARDLIRQVNSETIVIPEWTFGGGTAMMIQIDHRISHDVDLFIPDPQLLGYLDPRTRDFQFEIMPNDYEGDGARFLKLAFEGIGEIDFIVAQSKTENPTVEKMIEGEVALLETVPEIIAKKIIHRGASLKPRDIFDVAAAAEVDQDSLVTELRSYKREVEGALNTLDRLNPDFVREAISQLQINETFDEVAKTAIDRARAVLNKI